LTVIHHDRDGLMTIEVSDDFLGLLERLRWLEMTKRLTQGMRLHLRDGARLSPYVGFYAGNHVPEFGAFSYSFSPFDRMMSFGAYCSIGRNVRVMGVDHPLDRFSTTAAIYENHPIFAEAFRDAQLRRNFHEHAHKSLPVIGNDVWIAQDVLLARGITIGDGAVIGAGAVVVKNVPAYAIVAGVPAKVLRYRFSEAHQELLKASRWWTYAMPDLLQGPIADIPAFVDWLGTQAARGKIRHVRQFDESLSEIIRAGKVATFQAESGGLLISPA